MAAFIAAQRTGYQIPRAVSCRVLRVPRSWHYKWASRGLPPRAARRERLKAGIRRLFGAHKGKYGSLRITADLKEAGWAVSKNTVAALMAEMGLAARPKRKRRSATRPGRGRWRAPDLVGRDFPAVMINVKWYGDGTDIDTDEGKLYLASVLDAASRRILGFALSEHHDAELAYSALVMAVAVRGGHVPGVIMHTDQGSEYIAAGFRLRHSAGGDRLDGWPADMRIIIRRENPHPGAQLSLFEQHEGKRYQVTATNTPRGQVQFLEARHRTQARAEDNIRCAKSTGWDICHLLTTRSIPPGARPPPSPVTCWPGCGSSPSTATWPKQNQRRCVTRSCIPPGGSSKASAAGT